MVSKYQAEKILRKLFINVNETPESSIYYIGLFKIGDVSNLTESSFTGSEVNGGGYTRASIVVGGFESDSLDYGTVKNKNDIVFSASSSSWSDVDNPITAVGIYDSETGGNLLYYQKLSASRIVGSDTTVVFESGSLTVSIS